MRRSYPEQAATAVVVCILAGVGVFLLSAALSYWANRSDLRWLCVLAGIGLWASITSVYLAAPLLGVIAILGVLRNAEQTGQHQIETQNDGWVRRTSDRLLIASALLVLVMLLPIALRIAHQWVAVWFVALALLGVQMGRVSRRLARTAGLGQSRRGVLLVGAVALILVGVGLRTTGVSRYVMQHVNDVHRTRSFAGSPAGLVQTVVVPTLDTACPSDRNVIWCSSFQLAWNEVRDTVVGAPLQVVGAEETAARLNAAKQSVADFDANSVYAAGGWIEKGICERIKKDMAAKFPSYALPDFNDYRDGILAYSYLIARVPFTYPFRQVDGGLVFGDSRGIETRVAGFGLWQAHLKAYEKIRGQIEILYVRVKDRRHSPELAEYALDLCRYSDPYQVVVARVEPRDTLAETLEHVRTQIAEFKAQPHYEEERRFSEADRLNVPEMFWRIDHRFEELIGKGVVNVGMPIVEALQTIEFRLDRSGVLLESQAMTAIASRPRRFEFNRPFLIYVQKRDATNPFFVMWVDNAELLERK
ncbi:MAG: hypothetical protein ABFE13_19510 [Phycisphaerales bacterium]